nr:alpha/beta hydrolase [Candidatus Calescibacterium sp.]
MGKVGQSRMFFQAKNIVQGFGVFSSMKLWICVVAMLLFFGWSEAQEVALPFPESAFFDVEGRTFHVRLFPPSSIPQGKVLFVHGLGGSTFSWRYAPEYFLPEGLLLVMVDLPGFGYSARKGIGTMETQAELLWKLLDTLEMQERIPPSLQGVPWVLVGHSMGGGIVFRMAMERPERLRAVVLIAPAFGRRGLRCLEPFLSFPPLQGFFATAIRRAFLSPSRVRHFLAAAYGREPTEEEFLGYLTPLKRKGTSRALLQLLVRSTPLKLATFRGKPHPPFLVLLGEKDSWVRRDVERFLALFPDAEFLRVPDAAHCPMETHPEACYTAILSFILQHI